jgi:hypothetical protein
MLVSLEVVQCRSISDGDTGLWTTSSDCNLFPRQQTSQAYTFGINMNNLADKPPTPRGTAASSNLPTLLQYKYMYTSEKNQKPKTKNLKKKRTTYLLEHTVWIPQDSLHLHDTICAYASR